MRKIGFIVCNTYAKELSIAIENSKIIDYKTLVISSVCASKTQKDTDNFNEKISSLKDEGYHIVVIPSFYCSGCSESKDISGNILYKKPATCLGWVLPSPLLQYFIEKNYYIITPGWLVQWKYIVQKRWGFTKETARLFFAESAKEILLLDTFTCKDYSHQLKEFADFSGLPVSIIPIGNEYFLRQIEIINQKSKIADLNRASVEYKKETTKTISEYRMIVDLVQRLTSVDAEEVVVSYVFEMLSMFFAPENLAYVYVSDGKPVDIHFFNIFTNDHASIYALCAFKGPILYLSSNKGFILKIEFNDQIVGYVYIDNILFPELISHYKSIAEIIAPIFGILLTNVQQIKKIGHERQKAENYARDIKILNENYLEQNKELKSVNEELNQLNEELKVTNDVLFIREGELERSNKMKDTFFSIISHDLRNPIGSLTGLSEILDSKIKKIGDNELQVIANYIHTVANQTLILLENLLQWAQIQTGRLTPKFEEKDLNLVIDDVYDLMHGIAEQKKISIYKKYQGNVVVYIDAEMIKTVIRNLISNAIKFTAPSGNIVLEIQQHNEWVILSVKDSGLGIKPEIVKKLFKIDVTYTSIGTAKEKGTGLGLILCKEFVEMHNGEIWVESVPGEGSSFKVKLPLKKV